MEIVTKQMEINQIGKAIVNQFVVDEDYNVKDSNEDIHRIVMSEGNARITEITPAENYLRVRGELEFQILYLSDEMEPRFYNLTGEVPFEEMVYIEDNNCDAYDIKCMKTDLTPQIVHSRKLRIKAVVELETKSNLQKLEEIPIDISCDTKIYKKQKELELLKLQVTKKDTFRIKEEISLSGMKESIGTLLWSDIANRKLDTRLENDALQLVGEILVFCFYESPDGKIDWIEQAVPYQGQMECYGVNESMYHHVEAYLEDANVDVRTDEDGELRVFGIEGTLKLYIAVYEEEKVPVLEDLYSLEKNCVLQNKEVSYEQLVLQNHSKCKIMERISVPELKKDVLQICHSCGTIHIGKMKIQEDGLLVEGALQIGFLYVKADDQMPFDTWQGMVPFSYLIECNETEENLKYYVTAMLEQLSISLQGGQEIEIKGVLAFHGFFERTGMLEMIENVIFEDISMEELQNRPSVVGHVVKEGEHLWQLAKKYHTSVESICETNKITEETLKTNERLLIFKENMSIL